MASRVSRRRILVAAVTIPLLTSACQNRSESQLADDGLLIANAADELQLISLYQQAGAAVPEFAAGFAMVAQQHQQHREVLLAALAQRGQGESASTSATPMPNITMSLDQLREAERVAAQTRLAACIASNSESMAATFATIAASEASHVPFLTPERLST